MKNETKVDKIFKEIQNLTMAEYQELMYRLNEWMQDFVRNMRNEGLR